MVNNPYRSPRSSHRNNSSRPDSYAILTVATGKTSCRPLWIDIGSTGEFKKGNAEIDRVDVSFELLRRSLHLLNVRRMHKRLHGACIIVWLTTLGGGLPSAGPSKTRKCGFGIVIVQRGWSLMHLTSWRYVPSSFLWALASKPGNAGTQVFGPLLLVADIRRST